MRSEVIQQLQAERAKELSQKAARKAANAVDSDEDMDMGTDSDTDSENGAAMTEEERLAALVHTAESQSAALDDGTAVPSDADTSSLTTINDNSRRAFYREFQEVFAAADVLLMVLDARDPAAYRVKEVEEAVLATGGRKRLVLVLNKTDLVPRDIVSGWVRHLQRDFPTIVFKASTQEGRSHLGQGGGPTDAFGADALLQLLKNYARAASKKLRVRVGVVGYPNVGKSSLINSLKRARVCRVGATPGITTSRQEIHLDSTVTLIDCPGIVFSRDGAAAMPLQNCLKVEQLADPIVPAETILARVARDTLQRLYTLSASDVAPEVASRELLAVLARRLGKIKRGGVLDMEAAARHLLNDWNSGKIPYFTPVPTDRPHLLTTADVVDTFSPAFQLDGLGVKEEMATVNTLANAQSEAMDAVDSVEDVEDAEDAADSSTSDPQRAARRRLALDYDVTPTAEQAILNPQTNQLRAKDLKRVQKKRAKETRRSMQLD